MRKIHSVRNTGMERVLEERMFMCCCEKCMFGVGECAFPDYSDEWKLVSVLGKRHLKSFVKSGEVRAIQKWCNTKTKSICSQNQVSNLKRDECNSKSNVRKSARQKSSLVESDMDVSKSKLSASKTATRLANRLPVILPPRLPLRLPLRWPLRLMVHSFWTTNAMIVTQKVMSENQLGRS